MRRHTSWVVVFVTLLLSASSRAGEKVPAEEEPIYQGKSLTEWISDLKDPKGDNRPIAAQALAVFGPKREIVSALAAALEADNGDVVFHAAQTLGKFGPRAKEALPALHSAFKRLDDGPQEVDDRNASRWCKGVNIPRRAVAEALILIDDHPAPELAPVLVKALKTDDPDKRRDIVVKLGKLGSDAAKTTVPVLIAVLEDEGKKLRKGTAYYGELEENVKEIRLEVVKSLGRIGPAAKPAIHALTLAMKMAAPAKGTIVRQMEVSDKPVGSADAKIQPNFFTLVTGDKAMLQACAEALGRIRPEGKGTVGALRLALRDLDEDVRWAALCALLETGQDARAVVPILLNFVRDKDAALRRAAVEALGKSGSDAKPILPALTAALKDKDDSVRESAVKALGEMGCHARTSAPSLIAALKDANADVRAGAAESLGKIDSRDKGIVTALIDALGDKKAPVVAAAGKVLAQCDPKAKASIPPLLALVHSDDPEKRAVACLLLGLFGSTAKEAIPLLEKHVHEDPEQWVRLTARTGLAKIDSSRRKETLRGLIAILQGNKEDLCGCAAECLSVLGQDGDDVLPALRALQERSNDASLNHTISQILEEIEKAKKKPGRR